MRVAVEERCYAMEECVGSDRASALIGGSGAMMGEGAARAADGSFLLSSWHGGVAARAAAAG